MRSRQFEKKFAVCLIAAASCFCLGQQAGFRLSTNSPRPITELIDRLNQKYGWSIDYEDAPVVDPDDLIDITSPVYTGPERAYKFFSIPFEVQINLPDPATLAKQEETDPVAVSEKEREAVEAILQAYKDSGNRGSFTYSQNGKYLDVFPDRVRDKNGHYQSFEPMLSTEVTIPDKVYRLDQLIWLVCDQIAQKRAIPIIHGTAPVATLMGVNLREYANNEPARDFLKSAFEDSKAVRASHGAQDVRHFSWALLYDPGMKIYAMNIGWNSKDLPVSQEEPKSNPAASNQPSGPSRWIHSPAASRQSLAGVSLLSLAGDSGQRSGERQVLSV